MPSNLSGDPSGVSNSLSATVAGATNASPIVITTSAAHGFATGDTVDVSGVTGNTAANGEWTIAVVNATRFSLTGSAGNGAYAGGGTAVDTSLTPQFQIPSDGDDEFAATVNAAFEALADRTQFLCRRLRNGTYRVASIQTFGASSVGTNYFAAGAWGANAAFSGASAQLLGSIDAIAGDIVVADFCTTINANLGAIGGPSDQQYSVKLQQSIDAGVTKNDFGTALASIRDSSWSPSETKLVPVTLRATKSFSDAETMAVYLNGCVPVGSTTAGLHAQDAWTLTLTVLRAN